MLNLWAKKNFNLNIIIRLPSRAFDLAKHFPIHYHHRIIHKVESDPKNLLLKAAFRILIPLHLPWPSSPIKMFQQHTKSAESVSKSGSFHHVRLGPFFSFRFFSLSVLLRMRKNVMFNIKMFALWSHDPRQKNCLLFLIMHDTNCAVSSVAFTYLGTSSRNWLV